MIIKSGYFFRSLGRRLSDENGEPKPVGGGTGPGGTETPKPETVSREFAERVISEKKALQEKFAAQEAELKAFRDKQAEAELLKAKAAGDYETLEKTLKEQLAEKDRKLAEHSALLQNVRKMQAFRRVLGAEVPEKFRSLVELDEIDVDAEGNPTEASVTKYASNFRKQYGEIIGTPKKLPPDDGVHGTEKTLTVEEWKKLPYAEQKKRMTEVKWENK